MDDAPKNWLSIPARREIVGQLERTDLSADAKVLLGKILDTTVSVGGRLLEIGKQAIVFAFDLARRFRGIAFGVAIALTVSSLIASTPLVGGVLAATLTPLLLAFGLTMGAIEDLRNGALRDELAGFGRAMETAARG